MEPKEPEVVSEDAEPMGKLPTPVLPAQDEVYLHNIDDIPFRTCAGSAWRVVADKIATSPPKVLETSLW